MITFGVVTFNRLEKFLDGILAYECTKPLFEHRNNKMNEVLVFITDEEL